MTYHKTTIRTRLEELFFLMLLAVIGFGAYASEHPRVVSLVESPVLTVTVFDVGQGDAIFVETPEGKQMLIDGGPTDAVLSKLGSVMPPNDHSIDMVVLTHPHADHVDGLVAVLDRYQIDMIMMSDVDYANIGYQQFRKAIESHQIKKELIMQSEKFFFGGIAVDVLYPEHSFVREHPSNVHDSMIVLKLTDGSREILLTGDAEASAEKNMMKSGANLEADVLKVGHHGSKTSSTDEFLDAVHPTYAVISVAAKNKYGHPHQSVVHRLLDRAIKIFRTDEDGDVTIRTDGKKISIETAHSNSE